MTMTEKSARQDWMAILAERGLPAFVLLLLRQFQIEGTVFVSVAMFAFAGFAVHALLPLRLRLPFFAVMTMLIAVVLCSAGR